MDAEQLQWLREWIAAHPGWSRQRLAREWCAHGPWRNERGRLKDFAARSFRLQLSAGGPVPLPALPVQKRRAPRGVEALLSWKESELGQGALRDLQPVGLEVVRAGPEAFPRWAFYLDRSPSLGWRVVGENLGDLVPDRPGRALACLWFGAPAGRCRVRDVFLHGSSAEGVGHWSRLAHHTRFLILPWIRVPHLARPLLGQVVGRISRDGQDQ